MARLIKAKVGQKVSVALQKKKLKNLSPKPRKRKGASLPDPTKNLKETKKEGRTSMPEERDRKYGDVGGKPPESKKETDPRKSDREQIKDQEKDETPEQKKERETKEWKESEEKQIPHPYITPNPVPGLISGIVAPIMGHPDDSTRIKDPAHPTIEELQRGSIPIDNIAAKDTPGTNRTFREEIFDKIADAAGHPEPNRVGNELTRAENGIVANFGKVLGMQSLIEEMKDQMDDDQKKKADQLTISY